MFKQFLVVTSFEEAKLVLNTIETVLRITDFFNDTEIPNKP